jgi:ankyrin repeat protein
MRWFKPVTTLLVLFLLVTLAAPALTAEQDQAETEANVRAFLNAALEGDLRLIESLIAKGVDVNTRNVSGRTALHYASFRDHGEIIEYLVKQGALVDLKDKGGFTPLIEAVTRGNKAAVETLLDSEADINLPGGLKNYTPLQYAIIQCDEEILDIFLENKINPNVRSEAGFTLLHYGALGGSVGIVKTLLASGVDINAKDNIGRTPLHFAVSTGNTALRDFLLENGATTDISSMQPGRRPIFGKKEAIGSLGLAQGYTCAGIGQPGTKTVNLNFSINEEDVTLYPAPEEQEYLHIANLLPFVRAAEPQLPMKTFQLSLPHDVEVLGVEVTEGWLRAIDGEHQIVPGQGVSGRHSGIDGMVSRLFYHDDAVYDRRSYYPPVSGSSTQLAKTIRTPMSLCDGIQCNTWRARGG